MAKLFLPATVPSLPHPDMCLSSPWQSQAHGLLLHQAFPDPHTLTWQEFSCLEGPHRAPGDTEPGAVWWGGKSSHSQGRTSWLFQGLRHGSQSQSFICV